MKAFIKAYVDTDVVARAAGISLIVLNHSLSHKESNTSLVAGLNVLLLVAGYSFVRFLSSDLTASTFRRSLFLYGKSLLVPCFIALVAAQVAFRDFAPLDLLFISNLISPNHVAFFPAWYPMVIFQLLVILGVGFSIPGAIQLYVRHPVVTSFLLVIAAFALRIISFKLWDTSHLDDRVPQLIMWNFLAGGLIFSATHARMQQALPLKLAVFVILSLISFQVWGPDKLRFWTTLAAAGLLLVSLRLAVPFALGRMASIISQASLTIFLFHNVFLGLFERVAGLEHPFAGFVVAMSGSVAIWLVWTAGARAYRHMASGRASADSHPTSAVA